MAEHIGFPPELVDRRKMEALYAGLQLSRTDFFGNALHMAVLGTNYAFGKLRHEVDKADWVQHGRPAVVNAFYSAQENSIQFPAGILQGVFFSSNRPNYMNYGAIGWVIGHEVTHGFDDQGRQFDGEGNLVNWWHPDTERRWLLCPALYSFQVSGEGAVHHLPVRQLHRPRAWRRASQRDHIAGASCCRLHFLLQPQGENIADNGGLKAAYRSYSGSPSLHMTPPDAWVARHGPERPLPGLALSPKQLFWVGAPVT
jgi:hypothetical protein